RLTDPTRPPLFPYTTLFRSDRVQNFFQDRAQRARAEVLLQRGVGDLVQRFAGEVELNLVQRAEPLVLGDHRLARLREDAHEIVRDRKSTRLNSSHLGISYAV